MERGKGKMTIRKKRGATGLVMKKNLVRNLREKQEREKAIREQHF